MRHKLSTFAELAERPEPRWMIDKIFAENSLVILRARRENLKTFLALSWACSIVTGERWIDRETTKKDALIMIGEGVGGIVKRIRAWQLYHEQEVMKNGSFLAIEDRPFVGEERLASDLEQDISRLNYDFKPGLIIIDTLARHFGAYDENSTQDMNRFVSGCDRLRETFPNSAILVIHHLGKDAAKGSRGASSLEAAADTIVECKYTANNQSLEVKCDKQKDAEHFPTFSLTAMRAFDSLVMVNGDPGLPTMAVQRKAGDIIDILKQHPEGQGQTALKKLSSISGETFRKAAEYLVKTGRVTRDKQGIYKIAETRSRP